MAGHSKWNNIKQKKGAEDKKRAKMFTKIARLIISATKEGGSADPASNPTLRTAVEKAKAVNMPKANIERAIARGAVSLGKGGAGQGSSGFLEITYEGYGPGGVALLIEVVTDNKNRSASEVKNALSRYGGSLGEPGSASYAFSDGNPAFTVPVDDEDALERLLSALEEIEDVVKVRHNADNRLVTPATSSSSPPHCRHPRGGGDPRGGE